MTFETERALLDYADGLEEQMEEQRYAYSLDETEATCDWLDHQPPPDSEEQAEQHAAELRARMRGTA